MEQKVIKKIYTRTNGLYVVVEFTSGMLAAIGEMALRGYRNRWEKDLENIEADKSIIYPDTEAPTSYQDLNQQGRLIIDISKFLDDGIFRIRVDGQEIKVPHAELKALLECG